MSDEGVTEEEVNRIIEEIDYETNGTINYSEFLAATIPQEMYVTDDRLKALFSQFDGDGDEIISATNLKNGLHRFGLGDISHEEIDFIIEEYNLDNDAGLNFNEFKAVMFNNQDVEHKDETD